MAERWRLIESGPADGYRNMAVDEALLESCAAGRPGFPCLRLYAFEPPCLSLGFSQPHEGAVDVAYCCGRGIDVVRRPTGGRAVLHADEITYAVAGRAGEAGFGGSVLALYERVARALVAGFVRLGIDAALAGEAARGERDRRAAACFAEPSRHEIVAGASKLAGSALARRRGAFLQHGSIPLTLDAATMHAAIGEAAPEREPSMGLSAAAGRKIERGEAAAALRAGFEEALGAAFEKEGLTRAEKIEAEKLRAARYLTTAWTFRR